MRRRTIETKWPWGVAGLVILVVLTAPPARAEKVDGTAQYGIYEGNPGLLYAGGPYANHIVEMVQFNGQPAFQLYVFSKHGKGSLGHLFISASGVVCQLVPPTDNFEIAKSEIMEAKVEESTFTAYGLTLELRTRSKEYKLLNVGGGYKGRSDSPFEMLIKQMLSDFPSALAEFQKLQHAGEEAIAAHPQQALSPAQMLVVQTATFAMQSGAALSTPMPAKPAETGASLADTMKFIQDKLNESGQVRFAATITDGTDADPTSLSIVEAWTNVAADAATCRISYHSSLAANEGVAAGGDAAIAAWEIEKIEVLPMEQFFALAAAKAGRPQWSVQVQPPVSVLRAQLHGGGFAAFAFYDADLADRMAKAMVHAVELCGGGNKEPF